MGFESLVGKLPNIRQQDERFDFDLLIVGSGYGGSIAAREFAQKRSHQGRPLRIALLERGLEFLPGSFPNTEEELPTQIRSSSGASSDIIGNPEGLFDFRRGKGVNTLVANGLGGGSLINAAVLERPAPEVFNTGWPDSFASSPEQLQALFGETETLLGAYTKNGRNSIESHTDHQANPLKKFESLKSLQCSDSSSDQVFFRSANIGTSMLRQVNQAGIQLDACSLCGDCATGCNLEAKNSLDTNLLFEAQRLGVEIYTGASVLDLAPNTESSNDPDTLHQDKSTERPDMHTPAQGWNIRVAATDRTLAKREGEPIQISAEKVILAAGTFGSAEILMRSKARGLALSSKLGHNVSSNGDMIAVAYDQAEEVNAYAEPSIAHKQRDVGPTITGLIDARAEHGFVLQEMAIPAPLLNFFAESVTTLASLNALAQPDTTEHVRHSNFKDPYSVDYARLKNTSVYAMMGHDEAKGSLRARTAVPSAEHPSQHSAEHSAEQPSKHTPSNDKTDRWLEGAASGQLVIDWPELPYQDIFDKQIEFLDALFAESNQRGQIIANGTWRPLPESLSYLTHGEHGPLLTVHPLGGCVMANDHESGVVDDRGRVFNPSTGSVYQGLAVLDGSIIPTSLGINPALTIATVALRSTQILWLKEFPCVQPVNQANIHTPSRRPVHRSYEQLIAALPRTYLDSDDEPTTHPQDREPTSVEATIDSRDRLHKAVKNQTPERKTTRNKATQNKAPQNKIRVTERLSGEVVLSRKRYTVLLTCVFNPIPVRALSSPATLEINQATDTKAKLLPLSRIQLIESESYQALLTNGSGAANFEGQLAAHSEFIAPISGSLHTFQRASTHPLKRRIKAFCAWLLNRGVRDIWQAIETHVSKPRRPSAHAQTMDFRRRASTIGAWERAKGAWHLASRSGEVRTFDYQIQIGTALKGSTHARQTGLTSHRELSDLLQNREFTGQKRFTYERCCNPWKQLTTVAVQNFPLEGPSNQALILRLDTKYMARTGSLLIELSEQTNHMSALSDFLSVLLYVTRLCVSIHAWTLRLPDTPTEKKPERLPAPIPGLPEPISVPFRVCRNSQGQPVSFILTRYPGKKSQQDAPQRPQPILMIHGYSVSGNTFTHPALKPNMASYFWSLGYDVWVIDLRTSSALGSALEPWSFEDVAFVDIPIAIDYIFEQCNQQKIDIVAHCMGAAMFSMAVLSAEDPLSSFPGFKQDLIVKLEDLVRARASLPSKIRKAVFSQVGPTPTLSPDNLLRGYLMHYIKHLVSEQHYSFQRSEHYPLPEQLLDRILSTLPYPDGEFELENPRTPWKKTRFVNTRHRMDLLYGRDFNLKNIEPTLYDYFDDLFGPLNLQTVSQVTYFAQYGLITDAYGKNKFVSRDKIKKHWIFPSMSFHGSENGLIDPATANRLEKLLTEDACANHRSEIIEDYGHQDCLVGRERVDKVYSLIQTFLSEGDHDEYATNVDDTTEITKPPNPLIALVPWIGPILEKAETQQLTIAPDAMQMSQASPIIAYRISSGPVYGKPIFALTIPVRPNRAGTNYLPSFPWLEHKQTKDQNIEFGKWILPPNQLADDWYHVRIHASDLPSEAVGLVTLFLDNESGFLRSIHFPEAVGLQETIKRNERNAQFCRLHHFPSISEPSDLLTVGLGSPSHQEFWNHVHQSIQQKFEDNPAQIESKMIPLGETSTYDKPLNFSVGSCLYPPGILDKQIAFDSYERLAERLRAGLSLNGLLLLGDQIYADASAGMFDPQLKQERYIKPHESWLMHPSVSEVLRQTTMFCMLDDHEINDNFAPIADTPNNAEENEQLDTYRVEGIQAYMKYQRGIDGTPRPPFQLDYRFTLNQYEFFLANTRTERSLRNSHAARQATIMSREQMTRIHDFLIHNRERDRPMFLCCPSAVLPRRVYSRPRTDHDLGFLKSDAWDGFPASLEALMATISDLGLDKLILISGDEHVSSVTTVRIDNVSSNQSITIYSIHCSALYAPYPFANTRMTDLLSQDTWSFSRANTEYQVSTETTFYPGDGFALFHLQQSDDPAIKDEHTGAESNPKWTLKLEFDRGGSSKTVNLTLPADGKLNEE